MPKTKVEVRVKGLSGLPEALLLKIQAKEREKSLKAMVEPNEKKRERWTLQKMEQVSCGHHC